MRMIRGTRPMYGSIFLSLCVACAAFAGEEAAPQPAAEDAAIKERVDQAPGLRMDPILLTVAAQFLKGVNIGEVLPAGAVSSAEDGYVVTEYKVLDANAGDAGAFYRIRTLVGKPVRDVAVMIEKDGRLRDIFDLQPPAIDEEATTKAKAATAEMLKPKAGEAPIVPEVLRFKSAPSAAALAPMVGLEAVPEAVSLQALLGGLIRATSLASGPGMAGEDVKPKTPDAFKVEVVLPPKGTPAPEFSYRTVTGAQVSPATFRGKPYAVFISSVKAMQGITSAEPLERRGAVMMSRISRWVDEHKESNAVQKQVLLVLADKAEDLDAMQGKEGKALQDKAEKPAAALVADPAVLTTFSITINPMLLVYDEKGALIEAFGATSPADGYLKALDGLLK